MSKPLRISPDLWEPCAQTITGVKVARYEAAGDLLSEQLRGCGRICALLQLTSGEGTLACAAPCNELKLSICLLCYLCSPCGHCILCGRVKHILHSGIKALLPYQVYHRHLSATQPIAGQHMELSTRNSGGRALLSSLTKQTKS